jgi:prevent-host-death family protein
MKEVPLSEIKDDLSRFLREAETQEIVITRHGKPAGVLIGFESEEDWFEYRLEHDHASCAASNRRGTACAQDVGRGSKTSKRNNGTRQADPDAVDRTGLVRAPCCDSPEQAAAAVDLDRARAVLIGSSPAEHS